MIGPTEILLIVLVLVFLALGPRRIVDLSKAFGRGVKDFAAELERKMDGKELKGGEEDRQENPEDRR